jgi:diguanylate cyclase (GGDEF)-like protein
MEKTYCETGKKVKVSASMGAAFCEGNTKDIVPWIEQADTLLYRAKRNGRNQYCTNTDMSEN